MLLLVIVLVLLSGIELAWIDLKSKTVFASALAVKVLGTRRLN
jgi:hypothetical protein